MDRAIIILKLYWKVIVGFSVGFTSVVSYFLLSAPEVYVCELEFVPPDFSMASPLLENAALVPGSASDLERVYSYLHSYSLRRELIDTFDLYRRYGLDKVTNPQRRAKKAEAVLKDKIQIRITKNATILIRVSDTSPNFSYKLATFLQKKVERFCTNVIGMNEALAEKQRQIQDILKEIKGLEEELSKLRVTHQILTAGPTRSGTPSLPTKEAFSYYDRVLSMESRLVQLQETYAHLLEEKARREDFIRAHSSPIFLIQPPYEPTYPTGPNPYLVIALSLLGSIAFSTFVVIYAGMLGILRKKEEFQEAYPLPS
ncbi:MAG: hypothetical protein N2253_00335 [Bacteroidia bacterium]|nr:hypothetical protein [Bacteroidia bacterium]